MREADRAADEPDGESTPEIRWLTKDEQRSWRALLVGFTLLVDRLDEDMRREHGISMVEYEILVRLSEHESEMRMAQLADSLAHSRSRVTHTVKRMERDGLVLRCGSPDDGRGVVARMTDEGWHLLRKVAPSHVMAVREYLVDLVPEEDFAALGRVMNAVSDRLIVANPARELRDNG